jgi:DNA polymerase
VFAEALLRLARAGVNVVFHVHDEAVCEVPTGTGTEEITRLMTVTPDWLPGCPLAAEAAVTNHYCK